MSYLPGVIDMQEHSFPEIKTWIDAQLDEIAKMDFTPDITASFTPVELHETFDSEFGAEALSQWRKFFIATLLADWACYEKPVDRCDFPRLKYIMSSSSQYFRLWCVTLPDGSTMPVGYSAWYPIAKFVYDGVMAAHDEIDDRGAFMPLRFVKLDNVRYAYVINISIVKQLRNTIYSRRMIRACQREAANLKYIKGMAITVDEAGQKFSRLEKFAHLGDITVQGSTEGLFVRK